MTRRDDDKEMSANGGKGAISVSIPELLVCIVLGEPSPEKDIFLMRIMLTMLMMIMSMMARMIQSYFLYISYICVELISPETAGVEVLRY